MDIKFQHKVIPPLLNKGSLSLSLSLNTQYLNAIHPLLASSPLAMADHYSGDRQGIRSLSSGIRALTFPHSLIPPSQIMPHQMPSDICQKENQPSQQGMLVKQTYCSKSLSSSSIGNNAPMCLSWHFNTLCL